MKNIIKNKKKTFPKQNSTRDIKKNLETILVNCMWKV